MCAAVERNIRGEERPGSNGHEASVDDCAVEINEDVLAELDIGPVVDVDRCFDPGIFCE